MEVFGELTTEFGEPNEAKANQQEATKKTKPVGATYLWQVDATMTDQLRRAN